MNVVRLRTYLPYLGCLTLYSIATFMLLSPLLLTTVAVVVLIVFSSAVITYFVSRMIVFMRAISRRTFFKAFVFSSFSVTAWERKSNICLCNSSSLLPRSSKLISLYCCAFILSTLQRMSAFHKSAANRHLVCDANQRLLRDFFFDAANLKKNRSGLDSGHPKL